MRGGLSEPGGLPGKRSGAHAEGSEGDRADLQRRLDDRFREITALTVLLREQERSGETRQETIDWLCRIAAFLVSQPPGATIMPASWRARRRLSLLKKRGLFDADTYLRLNPDVAATEIDPLLHYLLHGLEEGRPRSFG